MKPAEESHEVGRHPERQEGCQFEPRRVENEIDRRVGSGHILMILNRLELLRCQYRHCCKSRFANDLVLAGAPFWLYNWRMKETNKEETYN